MPVEAPTVRPSVSVTTTDPSERVATVSSSPPPSRSEASTTVAPPPRVRSIVVQGDRPAASASDARHTSPATTQIPVRTPAATAAPTSPSPATAAPPAASAAATSASTPVYSSDA